MDGYQTKEKKFIKNEHRKHTHITVSDAELEMLVVRSMEGDSVALHELCDVIGRRVMFLVMRTLHNQMDAEDATQEVLMRMCNSIKGLREPKAFNGWLYSIVINETRRHHSVSSKYD